MPHLNLAEADAHVVATCGKRRRSADDVSVAERELRAMPRTFDGIADDLSFRQRTAEVRTRFADGENEIVALEEKDRHAVSEDARGLVLRERSEERRVGKECR